MIFLTLGTQLPFDRLVKALDEAAKELDEPIFGQTGKSTYVAKNFETTDFLTPVELSRTFSEARVVVGHAEIGTIISGMKAQKPLVLMARRARFGEHRNDHQLATLSQVRTIDGVQVVEDAKGLLEVLSRRDIQAMSNQASPSRHQLTGALRAEIMENARMT